MQHEFREWHAGLQNKNMGPDMLGSHGRPISRILFPALGKVAIIYLGPPSPTGSIGLPSGLGGHPSACQTFTDTRRREGKFLVASNAGLHGLSTLGVYLATDVATGTGGLLLHHFTLTSRLARQGGILSVALAVSALLRILPVR